MAAHPVAHGVAPRLHPADLLQGHAQFPQQLDLLELFHLSRAVLPIAVLAVAPGGNEALLLVKADILFGDAHLGLYLIDLHALILPSRFLWLGYTFHQGEGQGHFEKIHSSSRGRA